MPPKDKLRHLRIDGRAKAERYTTPIKFGGPFRMPPRDRQTHGEELLEQLNQANAEEQEQRTRAAANPGGIVIHFLNAPSSSYSLRAWKWRSRISNSSTSPRKVT